MKGSVFVGTSVDGYIARPDGALDFLPPNGGEPHGYDEFIASVDALIIGRKTYEIVLAFDTWPYGEKPVPVVMPPPVERVILPCADGMSGSAHALRARTRSR